MDKKRWVNYQEMDFDFEDLKEIFSVLRGSDGCPWDKAQTHESIRANAIEEVYELVDAIDRKDTGNMLEELGDNLLQVFFHIELAKENGNFGYTDVLNRLCRKLINRHSHIFGNHSVSEAEQALEVWERNKQAEKRTEKTAKTIPYIPEAMPALMRANKIQKKAAKVGFDWNDVSGALEKAKEEFEELRAEIKKGDKTASENEMGDLLFAVVNICRFLEIDPEVALNKTNSKFVTRFDFVEKKLKEQGKAPEQSNLAEMDKLWEQSKSQEGDYTRGSPDKVPEVM